MIKINILEDERLQNMLNKVISGLLPHDNFNSDYFNDLIENIFKLIQLDEFSGEYYILLNTLKQIQVIGRGHTEYIPTLTEEDFKLILSTNIDTLIRNPKVNIKDYLDYEGLDSNLQIETTLNTAGTMLYRRCLELYEDLFSEAISSEKSLAYIPSLQTVFIEHAANQALRMQVEVLGEGIRIGKIFYKGATDWIRYTREVGSELNTRLEKESDSVTVLDSTDKAYGLLEDEGDSSFIANFNIAPIDDGTPMMSGRLIVVAADPNVGKTKFATQSSVNAVLNNKRVVFMTGESSKKKAYSALISNYIRQKYNKYLQPIDVIRRNKLPLDLQKLIDISIAETTETKLITMSKAFDYDTVYDELVTLYENNNFDLVVVDHSFSLKGGTGTNVDKIDNLAKALRDFKNDYPVCVICLSHLNGDAKDAVRLGKPLPSEVTKWSGTLTAEADDVYILYKNEDLKAEGKIALRNLKRRDAEVILGEIKLRTEFGVSELIYKEEDQNDVIGLDDSAAHLIGAVKDEMLLDDDDEETLDEY